MLQRPAEPTPPAPRPLLHAPSSVQAPRRAGRAQPADVPRRPADHPGMVSRATVILEPIVADTLELKRTVARSRASCASPTAGGQPEGDAGRVRRVSRCVPGCGGELPTSVELSEDVDGVRLMTLYRGQGPRVPDRLRPNCSTGGWSSDRGPRRRRSSRASRRRRAPHQQRRAYVAMTRTATPHHARRAAAREALAVAVDAAPGRGRDRRRGTRKAEGHTEGRCVEPDRGGEARASSARSRPSGVMRRTPRTRLASRGGRASSLGHGGGEPPPHAASRHTCRDAVEASATSVDYPPCDLASRPPSLTFEVLRHHRARQGPGSARARGPTVTRAQ